jgi:hypothetical protein
MVVMVSSGFTDWNSFPIDKRDVRTNNVVLSWRYSQEIYAMKCTSNASTGPCVEAGACVYRKSFSAPGQGKHI